MPEDFTFDEWFDIFIDQTRKLNYAGSIDKDSFEDIYEGGKSPEDAAEDFVKEMTD